MITTRSVLVVVQVIFMTISGMAAWYAHSVHETGMKALQAAEGRVLEIEARMDVQQEVVLSMLDAADFRISVSKLIYMRAGGQLKASQVSEISVQIAEAYMRNPAMRPSLVLSVIEQESSYRPGCVSPKGARGLMQVMPTTARPYLRELGYDADTELLFDPIINTRVGIAYLEDLMSQYNGNEVAAINAYFWGPRNVNKMIEDKAQLASLKYGLDVLRRARTFDIL